MAEKKPKAERKPNPNKSVWKKQERDAKGHFQSYDGCDSLTITKSQYQTDIKSAFEKGKAESGEHTHAYDIKQMVREAYIAGLNSQGGILTPTRKVEMYLWQKGF
jgi:hypothetical protein